MPQADTPPAAVAEPPAMHRLVSIATEDRPLVLVKGERSEAALARQAVFLKMSAREEAALATQGEGLAFKCRWIIEAYHQRDFCFTSITGQTACTEPMTRILTETEAGETLSGPDAPCGLELPEVARASDRLGAIVQARSAVLFKAEYEQRVRPGLLASGVKLTERPPARAATSPTSGSGTR
ncbi:hypothetical protein DDF62_12825 [Caulobacter radicis]|uniref:hypothetical protein n=1 Tax=Caulobacter radicis TaxID=2172650 RepID=UPI000D585EB4|nr:hypothetical protein [Caulobacter radicis]PVM89381.1 hypothetical protein DDF62_12825 [Caulobacter radicis]